MYFGLSVFNCTTTDLSCDNLIAIPSNFATAVSNNGQGINLNVMDAPPAVLGQPWSAQLTINEPTTPASGFLALWYSGTGLATGPRLTFGGPVTEVLIGPGGITRPCGVETYAGTSATASMRSAAAMRSGVIV